MPQVYVRKTTSGLVTHDDMLAAIQLVLTGRSVRAVSGTTKIKRSVLGRYVKKYKEDPNCRLTPDYTHSQVFSGNEEDNLARYLIKSSKMFHGLTALKTRQLAYEMAMINGLEMPQSWHRDQLAGESWFTAFLLRNGSLSIRSPEATSLARATAFNKANVGAFYDIIEHVLARNIPGKNILNLDETGLTTVQKVPRVVSQKGSKQVGQVTSAERGELVTMCGIVSATGVAYPPVFIFPRKNYRDQMATGGPEGCLGLANPSGWMNSEMFYKVMEHLVKCTGASKQNEMIVVMDNHESHISVESLDYAKDHGIHVVTLPPHTSHKLQPLDITVYGPLKHYYNMEANSWMMRHPGKTVTIYEIAQLVGQAWPKAATPHSILAGFRAAGIWPFNRDIFPEDAFLPAAVTDRPNPEQPASVAHPERAAEPPERPAHLDRAAAHPERSATYPETATTYHKRSAASAEQAAAYPEGTATYRKRSAASAEQGGAYPETAANFPKRAAAHSEKTPQMQMGAFITPEKHLGYPNAPEGTATYRKRPAASAEQAGAYPETAANCPKRAAAHSERTTEMPQAYSEMPTQPEKTPQMQMGAFITPEKHLGYPKAPERKPSKRGRKRGKTMLATGTPELRRLRIAQVDKLEKAAKAKTRPNQQEKRKRAQTSSVPKTDKQLERELSEMFDKEDSDEDYEASDRDDDDSESEEVNELNFGELSRGEFVVIKYEGELFPGKIIKKKPDGAVVSCLQVSGQHWRWPEPVDEHFYTIPEIERSIATPKKISNRGTYAVPELKGLWY